MLFEGLNFRFLCGTSFPCWNFLQFRDRRARRLLHAPSISSIISSTLSDTAIFRIFSPEFEVAGAAAGELKVP
jgi:hypothetical protein